VKSTRLPTIYLAISFPLSPLLYLVLIFSLLARSFHRRPSRALRVLSGCAMFNSQLVLYCIPPPSPAVFPKSPERSGESLVNSARLFSYPRESWSRFSRAHARRSPRIRSCGSRPRGALESTFRAPLALAYVFLKFYEEHEEARGSATKVWTTVSISIYQRISGSVNSISSSRLCRRALRARPVSRISTHLVVFKFVETIDDRDNDSMTERKQIIGRKERRARSSATNGDR